MPKYSEYFSFFIAYFVSEIIIAMYWDTGRHVDEAMGHEGVLEEFQCGEI